MRYSGMTRKTGLQRMFSCEDQFQWNIYAGTLLFFRREIFKLFRTSFSVQIVKYDDLKKE